MTRRWEYLVAGVELACGVGVAVSFVVVGATAGGPDRTAFDRAFPFVLAALALGVLGMMAWRSLRRARATPTSAGAQGGSPGSNAVPSRTAGRGREPGTPGVPPPPPVEVPELSQEGRAETERLLRVLGEAGVLAPAVPDVDAIAEAVADAGEPPTTGSVLGAIGEAGFWHPGFDAEPHLANLAFHDGHVEQFVDTLRDQVDDLARLVDDPLHLEHFEITDDWRHHLRLRLGDDVADLDYAGHPKYLSTVLHVTVARAARPRLAWLHVDQGVWIVALRGTTVDELNARLEAPDHERWTWVDEEEPLAAG